MEPKGSLPCSQDPSTGPYPEPDQEIHDLPTYICKIHSNVILSTMPTSFELTLPFMFHVTRSKFRTQFLFPQCVLMPRPSQSPWLDHPNNIWWSVQVLKFLIMQSSPVSRHFLLGPNILLSTLFSDTLSLCSYLSVRDQVSHPYKNAWSYTSTSPVCLHGVVLS
jgi:hypothetical protein